MKHLPEARTGWSIAAPAAAVLFILMIMVHTLFFERALAAQIKVSVDRNPVSIDESFQIIFSAAETPDADPDFSPLEQDFDIINQNNSSSVAWLNGIASKTVQWTLAAMAKQSGSLIIPPVKFGKDLSQALNITVTQSPSSSRPSTGEEIILEVEATPKEPFVQSQILYKVSIFSRIEIARASLNEPELDDAIVEKLGDDSNYATRLNGVNYSVTERKYAIIPQKSGIMTIKPLVLNAEVLTNNRPSFNGFFNRQLTQTRKVRSKAVSLTIKPVPANFPGTHWLAAEQLSLSAEWSGDASQMKVGEPLTRTLTLLAKGTTVGQLPELNTAETDDRLKIYPDQPVLKEQKKPEGLIAFRQEKIALIPSKAGNFTLPAIEIPWFNTKKQMLETAAIPATTISVLAAGGGAEAPAQASAMPPAALKNNEQLPLVRTEKTSPWLWTSVFLAIGWLATLVLFLRKPPANKPVLSNEPLKSNDEGIKLSDLKKACADNNAMAVKNILLAWGRQQYGATSLSDIAAHSEARLRDEILELSRTLYSKEAHQWQGKKLLQAFSEHKARKQLAAREEQSLQALYRL